MTFDNLVSAVFRVLQEGTWDFTSHEHIRAVLRAAKVDKLLDEKDKEIEELTEVARGFFTLSDHRKSCPRRTIGAETCTCGRDELFLRLP